MRYLLDTDITSYLIKRKSPYHEKVLKKVVSLSPSAIAISSITVSELVSGLKQIPVHNHGYQQQLVEALEYFITSINVVDYTIACARIYGDLRARLKMQGNDIGAMDCLIAAHALAEDRVLVTNNLNHFNRIEELILENWAG